MFVFNIADRDSNIYDMCINNKTISYNLAIEGVGIEVESFLIEQAIEKEFKPDFVIWWVTYLDFYEHISNQDEALIFQSPMGRYHTENTTDLEFEDLCEYYLFKYSRIFRYRTTLLPSIFFFNSSLR